MDVRSHIRAYWRSLVRVRQEGFGIELWLKVARSTGSRIATVLRDRPQDNDDALSRRDMGLEFLDVTAQVDIALSARGSRG